MDRTALVTGANRGIGLEVLGAVRICRLSPGHGDPRSRSRRERLERPRIVWLATLPEDGPSGGFFRDRRAIPW